MKKKTLAFILAVLMVVGLFTGCAPESQPPDSGDSTPTNTPGTPSATPGGNDASGDDTEDSPYKFAKGKFETDERGISTQPYTYEMPLSTTDEVFSCWTTNYTPQYIPEEGFGSMPLPAYDRELTGVNIEYEIVSTSAIQTNFSVLRASDDFRDLMCNGATYYGGLDTDILTEGYFVNLYDYREYIPNYMYLTVHYDPTDTDTYDKVFLADDQVASMWVLYANPVINGGHTVRADWLDELGMSVDDIVTFDDLYDVLMAVKTQIPSCEYPFALPNCIEQLGVYDFSPSYDTQCYVSADRLAPNFLVDGKVTFSHMNDSDREFLRELHRFFDAGLITPDWAAYSSANDYRPLADEGEVFYYFQTCADTVSAKYTNVDPDCEWVYVNNILRTEDQKLRVGSDVTRLLPSCCFNISSKCENIELLATWCDWFFSEEGGDLWSYGIEGYTWEYDSNGNRIATELITNNPDGLSYTWAMCLHAVYMGGMALRFYNKRNFMDPNTGADAWAVAEAILEWNAEHYDKSGHYPAGARLSDDDSDLVNSLSGDVATFMAENYMLFITQDRSLDNDWDDYVAELDSIGMGQIIEAYQRAYDNYIAA